MIGIEGPWKAAFMKENVKKSFKLVGIQPFNPQAIPHTALAPSLPNSIKETCLFPETKAQKAIKAVFSDILAMPLVQPPSLNFDYTDHTTEATTPLKPPQNIIPTATPLCARQLCTLLHEDDHHFIISHDPVSPSKPMPEWIPPVLSHPKLTATSVYGSIGIEANQRHPGKIHKENLALQEDLANLKEYTAKLEDLVQRFQAQNCIQDMMLVQTQNQFKTE